MSRIPFVLGRFPDPKMARLAIEQRLNRHFSHLQEKRAAHIVAEVTVAGDNDDEEHDHRKSFPWAVRQRITRRAERLNACDLKRSVLANLRPEDRKRLEPLKAGLEVVAIPSAHRADEIAAALHEMYPWMDQATRAVWQDMRQSVERGDPGVRISPLLLDGPAGIGKSHFARDLAKRIAVPSMVVEASNENAGFGLVGSQKAWGNSSPGRLMNFIITEGVMNPVITVDEVEKAGVVRSNKGQTFALAEALLPLLEPLSAGRWTCPYFEVPFDMGWVGWVMTTNDYRLLPDPLLSRCPPISIPAPTVEQLKAFARRQGAERNLGAISIEAICDALDRSDGRGKLPDLRTVIRMLETAQWLERRPPLH